MGLDGLSSLILYDGDTPIAIAWRREDGMVAMSRAGEADFERLTVDMGFHKRSGVRCVRLG